MFRQTQHIQFYLYKKTRQILFLSSYIGISTVLVSLNMLNKNF